VNYGIDMTIRQLSSDEGAVNIMNQVLPGLYHKLGDNPQAKDMSIRKIALYAKGMIPEDALSRLDLALREYGSGKSLIPAEKRKIALYKNMDEDDRRKKAALKDGSAGSGLSSRRDSFTPGAVWTDTDGRRIQAHGGAIFYENGIYYWYGENKEHTDGVSDVWTWGIRYYRSTDLYNWENMGYLMEPVFDDPDSPFFPDSHLDRPHIRKCRATGKYVAWVKLSGEEAFFTVLEADHFEGPYEIVKDRYRPRGFNIGDFDIASDAENGKSYLYVDADHKAVVCLEMSEDLHSAEKEVSRSYEGLMAPFTREGISVLEHKGSKYMLTSGMTGYIPNRSDTAVAAAWTDVFKSCGDPYVNDFTRSSFNSQFTQVFKVPERNLYIALSDRWVPEFPVDAQVADMMERVIASTSDPEHYSSTREEQMKVMNAPMLKTAATSIADYVWLPVSFEADGKIRIEWKDEWKL
jgi:hypothetical protein